MKLVGITGYKGSGKTTASTYLRSARGFHIVPLASVLKDMLKTFGLTDRQIYGDQKESTCDADLLATDILCGKSPRHAMQTLGTEWGRHCIGEDVWIRAWWAKVEKLDRRLATHGDALSPRPGTLRACCDDVRFANEADFIRSKGGRIILVKRDGCEGDGHASEALDFEPDVVIHNDAPISNLYSMLDEVIFQ